jgi:pimeloyl-ACP methyl ester carboxylesterase
MPAYATSANKVFWSDGRLAPEVVSAASNAVDQAKRMTSARFVHLLGYSGGGGLAVLLAENRGDVLSLVTIAGLLDTDWWVTTRGYRPLSGSLNPADRVERIAGIPQLHFYGTVDKIIPPEMSQIFSSKVDFRQFQRVPVSSDHYNNWTARWRELLENYVIPLRSSAAGGATGI